jgi:hypothetical protein
MRKSGIGPLDNFVEQIKLYHNPKVHYKLTVFKWNVECHEMISKIGLKKSDLNNDTQQFVVPNNDIQQFFVPNNDR